MIKCSLKKSAIVIAVVVVVQYAAFAQLPECTGVECVKVISVKYGTRCGNKPNSVSVDIQNASSTMYMMGYAVFATSTGPLRVVTGYVAPGATMNLYNCDSTAAPTFDVNTGPKDTVRAPMYRAGSLGGESNMSSRETSVHPSTLTSCTVGEMLEGGFSDGEHQFTASSEQLYAVDDTTACPAREKPYEVFTVEVDWDVTTKKGIALACHSQTRKRFVRCDTYDNTRMYKFRFHPSGGNHTAVIGDRD